MKAFRSAMEKRFVGTGNEGFRCAVCGREVPPLASGGYRNHCPFCLWSRHVDKAPGDRKESCGGLMEPIGLDQTGKKGFVILHRCTRCGVVRRNKAALDDPVPDNWDNLVKLAQSAGGLAVPKVPPAEGR